MKSISIKSIRRRHRKEWLLIGLDVVDQTSNVPLRGTLLAHSPRRSEIDRASIKYPKPALVVFSEDDFPPGFVAAFLIHG